MSTLARRARNKAFVVLVTLVALCVMSAPALAQSTNRSGLEGKITDDTGAVLPGVTVTISSPALQTPQLVAVTDAEGKYRFSLLPAGVYSIAYQLSGFQTTRRTEFQITAGAISTIDLSMKLGAVEESITVSGLSPVVDTRTTNVSTDVTAAMLDTLPTSRSIPETLRFTPGIKITGPPDVGGSQLGVHENFTTYGVTGSGNYITLDGVFTFGAFEYYDMGSLAEVQVKAVGNDAEVPVAGTNFVGILKSGGNEFHGGGMFQYESPKFQSNNLDADLAAQGVTTGNALNRYYDSNVDLGGPVVPNRIWFYGGGHWQETRNYVLGYSASPGPDGTFFTGDDVAALAPLDVTNYVVKGTSQLTRNQRLEGYYDRNNKHTPANLASRFRPEPSVEDYTLPANTTKVEWTWVPTNDSFLNVFYAKTGWLVGYAPYSDAVSTYDVVTLRYSGAFSPGSGTGTATSVGDNSPPSGAPSNNDQVRVGYSRTLKGRLGEHQLKIGGQTENTYYNKFSTLRGPGTGGTGNDYTLIYQSGVPFEIQLYNTPVSSKSSMNDQAAYIKDEWRLGDRLTLNLGIRLEHYHSFFPDQPKPAGPFSAAASFPSVDNYNEWLPAPRAGLSYVLTADQKTVLKSTFGRYNYYLNAQASQAANPNAFSANVYRWSDLNKNGAYDPNELGSYVNTVGGASRAINPSFTLPEEYEGTVHVERELFPKFLARAGYVYKREANLYQSVNVLRPYSAYNIPITATDPGPDGKVGTADDGGPITYYDYSAAYAGPQFVQNMLVNTPGYTDQYHSIEFVGEKRLSSHWQMIAYLMTTKNDKWLAGVPDTPNGASAALSLYPKDETWTNQFKLSGSYDAPFGIQLATTFEHREGDAYGRTVRFTAGLKQLSSVLTQVEPIGSERYPATNLLSMRAAKELRVSKARLDLQFDLYNALNINAATAVTTQSGATFGQATTIVPPRLARFGIAVKF